LPLEDESIFDFGMGRPMEETNLGLWVAYAPLDPPSVFSFHCCIQTDSLMKELNCVYNSALYNIKQVHCHWCVDSYIDIWCISHSVNFSV